MYVGPNRTRVNVVYSVEFIKSTWIRAAIEKGANDGIREDYRVLDKYLMGFLEKNPEGNSAEENYSGMENLQLQQNPQQLPQQYQRRTSMLQSMKSRRRGAAVNIETSHFAHHSSSKTRSNNKPPSSSTSSASSTISSARSAPPTATSKSDYKTNLVAVFLDPIFSSIKIRFKTLTTPTASVPKWVSFIAWINVIILLVVNLLILWRVSMVMERFDERFRLLLLDDRHSLAAILPHTAPNSLLSDILGDIKQHGVKMREELLRLKTTIEEVKAIQESGK